MKPKKKVSNIMLVLICTMVILYTIAAFALQFFTQIEISPTVTTAWYAFWGVELINLTLIKTSKIKHGVDQTLEPEEDIEEEYTEEEISE